MKLGLQSMPWPHCPEMPDNLWQSQWELESGTPHSPPAAETAHLDDSAFQRPGTQVEMMFLLSYVPS